MAAPKGNRFWERCENPGRPCKYETQAELWEKCLEYFSWVEDNPLEEQKYFTAGGKVEEKTVYKMRAMTVKDLTMHLNICVQTWENYCNRKDFVEVTTRARNIIDTQKFQGAAADLLNSNIISRDLGLRDTTTTEHTGSVGLHKLGADELDAKIESLISAGTKS